MKSKLLFKDLAIDTYKESIIYLRHDCPLCLAEKFESRTYVEVEAKGHTVIATINTVKSDLLNVGQAALSQHAAELLEVKEGDEIDVSHAQPLVSLSAVRSKIFGHELNFAQMQQIISDINSGHYSDIQIASFLTACASKKLNRTEIASLTKAMVNIGDKIDWQKNMVVDKHCIGGLPGDRTTPIIVPIVAAFGLTIPKTSSRAVTSAAGTADAVEVVTNVKLNIDQLKNIVEQHNGCLAWGGAISLSPADDILINVERALELDAEGQLVASVLSKKIAAGSTHVLIDIPVGKTAKIRSTKAAQSLKKIIAETAANLGIKVKIILSNGLQPIGYGIGPALEARDFMAVLKNDKDAPTDLREQALMLAGEILEFSPKVKKGKGKAIAKTILESGEALAKFKEICLAQGGLYEIPQAKYVLDYYAPKEGVVIEINNRQISLVAKFAGAPLDKVAGVDLRVKVGHKIKKGDLLFTLHSSSRAMLEYALDYFCQNDSIIKII